ncbi:unnamed protein product [Trifolium pratense]|uniref:Uncharacterized protein n=1 Tax=Trifolium pratense TaxID=57577 RepID=A0ACB0IYM7_TRIPR|nr:unnamed protein product [Trifolium pratense]
MAEIDNGDNQPLFSSKFGVILIAMGSASFVVTMYHLIVICCQNSAEQARQNEQPATQTPSVEEGCLSHQIPSHKYEKKKKNDENDEDDCVTCPVCLGDFEEGEELRTMPSCMHFFHVPCIDMWLISHFNCPVCRADATPSPVVPHSLPEVASNEVNVDQGINMVQIVVVQNELQSGLPIVPS